MIFRNIHNLKALNIGGVNINNLQYADNTVLLAESETELQDTVDCVNEHGRAFGMKMNAKKTKTMLFTRQGDNKKISLKIDDVNIEQVKTFTYLGQLVTENGKCEDEVKRRIAIARSAF